MMKDKKLFTALFILISFCVSAKSFSEELAISRSEAAVMRSTLVEYSKKYIGCPYASGAVGPKSFDCSGFVFAVSRESIKVQLPRTTRAMLSFSTKIDATEREAGDLIFFKTTSSGEVSHVGIYIGHNQFIHCASDGPNTGVIVSSLKESYWKAHYYCTARYLPSSKSELLADNVSGSKKSGSAASEASVTKEKKTSENIKTAKANNSEYESDESFLEKLVFDASIMGDWNFYAHDGFALVFRGISSMVNLSCNMKYVQPGIGAIVRWDTKTRNFRMPIVLSFSFLEYFRAYAGPVIYIKHPRDPENGELIKQSVFPGIFGFSVSTPAIQFGKSKVSFVNDIHYTVFKNWNNSSMSFKHSIATGLILSTGFRVTLPMKAFFNK